MRIGVFGDSYAWETADGEIWLDHLKKFGHDIQSFAVPGSSIVYSAKMINNYCDYDLIIWCMTIPGRFSFKSPKGKWIHSSSVIDYAKSKYKDDQSILDQLDVCYNYQMQIMHMPDEEFVGRCIAEAMLARHKNLMIIPCFSSPLNLGFSLFDISSLEMTLPAGAVDPRVGHMLPHNHKTLAKLINENLKPGYFTTSLDNFKP